MADGLVARHRPFDALAVKGYRRRLPHHVLVYQCPAGAYKIAIVKLHKRRLARLPLWVNREHEIFALDHARSRHAHSGKRGHRGRLCSRAILARGGVKEDKAAHPPARSTGCAQWGRRLSNKQKTFGPEKTLLLFVVGFRIRGSRAFSDRGSIE
jgi:hypothetical protein